MFDALKKKLQQFSEQLQHKTQEKQNTEAEKETPPTTVASPETKTAANEKPKLTPKIGITQQAKSLLTGTIEITGKELTDLLEELELSLLEADVEHETALQITEKIRTALEGQKINRKESVQAAINQAIQNALLELMALPTIDLLEKSTEKKPLVILLLGPNGAGKTTTLAKLTHFFKSHHKSCIWAAADTFRAASIEQLEKHATALNTRVIKHQYGADPAAVAFDAIAAAKAHQTDIVLIDSAGRQETNQNLMQELEKIVRVAKPDLKIMVAESYSGQSLLQQAEQFNQKLGLDGFILTKLDADPKGGTLLSILFKIRKPVLFVGTGQEYEHLEKFNAEKIVHKII